MASKLCTKAQNEWYIYVVPSNAVIFVDKAVKQTLVENMKEAIDMEKFRK